MVDLLPCVEQPLRGVFRPHRFLYDSAQARRASASGRFSISRSQMHSRV